MMRRTILNSAMLLSAALFTPEMSAIATPNSSVSTQVAAVPKGVPNGYEEEDLENKGNRMPSRRLNCTISEAGGVQICGVQADEMLSFEVNEYTSGVCVGTFFEEEEFVSSIFTLTGDYSISIETADCIYIGYISL